MQIRSQRARTKAISAEQAIRTRFIQVRIPDCLNAVFLTADPEGPVCGVAGLKVYAPVVAVLTQEKVLADIFNQAISNNEAVLFVCTESQIMAYCEKNKTVNEMNLSAAAQGLIKAIVDQATGWGGQLDENGALESDLESITPGPHYYTNLLIGNRMGFQRPLQSTPKSVVDRLGRGSFRSHADTQVLATRWDYLPEENGFPANRQFYLIEDGCSIFYSGSAKQDSVHRARCRHAQNRTEIEYELTCGLRVLRTIFILPQKDGMPLATEAQMIRIENKSDKDRQLRLVYTGMLGTSEVHALREDVIFTTVVAQSEVFYGPDNEVLAVSFNPNPTWTKGNIRYSSLIVHQDDGVVYPDQFCMKYSEFVGSGTLEQPEYVSHLSNRHSRKGPGFFAMSAQVHIKAGETVRVDNFTCLSSDAVNNSYVVDETMKHELNHLLEKYSDEECLIQDLKDVIDFNAKYASYLNIRHSDRDFESYVNHNLPYQVFYQTFVSRSFDWTQKGYREIGFREIQDVFASMYYFAGMGRTDFVKDLIREWAGNVYLEGYANHNFYWKGKEPGWWSDDSLWLLQALDRYLKLTGDYAFLDEALPVAGAEKKTRPLSQTIQAIITYSAKISIGEHGLPLIDRADWNDCLRLDPDCISGPDKIEHYRSQLSESHKKWGEEPLKSEYSESVMNGFLLKVAVDAAYDMFDQIDDADYAQTLSDLSSRLGQNLRDVAWKNDFFARVLFNRKSKPHLKYLGASGDGLAIEEGAQGAYFLNSFSWSVLSGCAQEKHIRIMLDAMDRHLRTPYGFRVCTGVDYPQIAPKIDVALYYPGDRENGGVFKHANMMAAAAMLKAARDVEDVALAERLAETAYWTIDCILPYKTMETPFETCGNPRFCTQYNNSQTGENIGPTLSGTSTWLLLCLFRGLGIEYTNDALELSPILRPQETHCEYTVNTGQSTYEIQINKPEGFRRNKENVLITCDGQPIEGEKVPIFNDGKTHQIIVQL